MRVLLPIDESECTQRTLDWVAGFLSKTDMQLYLLHVVDTVSSTMRAPEAPIAEFETDTAKALLENAKAKMTGHGFTVVEAKYILDNPVNAICRYADEKGIHQIIMGSHGRTGLAHLLMGSVSEGVFRKAKQPVLVINTGVHPAIAMSHPEQGALR